MIGVLEGSGPAGRRDDRGRGPLRPPGPRRADLGLAGDVLERHPQRGRRQRLGHGPGDGAGPTAGQAGRPPAPPGRLHGVLGRGEGAARLAALRRAPADPARQDGHDDQLRHGRPAQREGRADRRRHREHRRDRGDRRRPGHGGRVQDQEGQGDVRRLRRERPRVVLPQGRADPLPLHRPPRRLPPAERRHRADQLRRDGPDRRLRRAAPARRRPPADPPRVHQGRSSSPRTPTATATPTPAGSGWGPTSGPSPTTAPRTRA